jgi:SPP1 family predicted phage head-tail adaptor
MRAGKLRHYVTYETKTLEQDSDGAVDYVWSDYFGFPVATEISPASGREFMAAQAVQSNVTARLKVRYRDGFVPTMRAVYRGKYYNIEAVLPDPVSGQEYLTLLCSTGVNEG